jgi:hypothetical protein
MLFVPGFQLAFDDFPAFIIGDIGVNDVSGLLGIYFG